LAVVGEQLGFIGVFIVVSLFMVVLVRGLGIANRARDEFGRFLAFGITLLISLQALINMLVAVALIPTKGLTLPFVSYGGSSMVVSCLALGILLNISRSNHLDRLEERFPSPPESAPPKAPRKQRKRRKRRQTLDEVLK